MLTFGVSPCRDQNVRRAALRVSLGPCRVSGFFRWSRISRPIVLLGPDRPAETREGETEQHQGTIRIKMERCRQMMRLSSLLEPSPLLVGRSLRYVPPGTALSAASRVSEEAIRSTPSRTRRGSRASVAPAVGEAGCSPPPPRSAPILQMLYRCPRLLVRSHRPPPQDRGRGLSRPART